MVDSENEVNAIHPSLAKQLALPIRAIDVGAQKIDGTTLHTYKMIVAAFSVVNKANRVRFFEKTFLVANVWLEVVLGISFLTLSDADVDFSGRELWWRTYTTKEALPNTRRVELVGKKEFAVAAINPEHETYVIHVASLSSTPLKIYHLWRPLISSVTAEETLTNVPNKYDKFADVFFLNLVAKLPKHTGIIKHAIELVDGQQPLYGPIYSLEPVELKTLKAYIKTNLANSFIWLSTSSAFAPILFDWKSDSFLWLCVNYQDLNNLTIKNRYLLPLIGESLDRLGRARWFTQLDLISTYHWIKIRKGDKWKIVFKTWYGHFEYQVMSFGLMNVPASFQGLINKIVAKKLDIFVIVYLDDILIYTNDNGNSHVAAVQWVLKQLRKYLLYINLKKYWFHQEEVWFLGYMMFLKGSQMEVKKIKTVK